MLKLFRDASSADVQRKLDAARRDLESVKAEAELHAETAAAAYGEPREAEAQASLTKAQQRITTLNSIITRLEDELHAAVQRERVAGYLASVKQKRAKFAEMDKAAARKLHAEKAFLEAQARFDELARQHDEFERGLTHVKNTLVGEGLVTLEELEKLEAQQG